jgi:hypothetical protein
VNVYFASDLKNYKVQSNLQKKRKEGISNFLACPAVRDGLSNVFGFRTPVDLSFEFSLEGIHGSYDVPISRKPPLENSNIFNLQLSTFFFAEDTLSMKVTSPYFEKASYLSSGVFIGGVFDIGNWFRPLQAEIITHAESGDIQFYANEPLFYAEFQNTEPVVLKRFQMTELLESLSFELINSPFQAPENFQGSLKSRYEAFKRSGYRAAILEEIQANLLPAEG